jgi:hypothetical protein
MLLLAIVVASGVQAAENGEAENDAAALDLRYRRIFVPQEAIASQVRGLLPLKRDEFERRIAEWEKLRKVGQSANQPHLERGEYSAELRGEFLTGGTAQIDIHWAGEGSRRCSLEPCNLALENVTWFGGEPRTALLGLDAAARTTLLAPGSGQLRFDWSKRGSRNNSEELVFDIRLPRAPVAILKLRLPASATLSASSGIVTETPASNDMREWRIELGGDSQTVVTIATDSSRRQFKPLLLVREAAAYTFAPATVDLDVTF